MVFCWYLFIAFVWKKVVFLSPAFNQLFRLLWCHISFSMPSHLFSSLFISWIDSKSTALPFMDSSILSLFWRAVICFPTWPKVCLFHDFKDLWHSSKQASSGQLDSLLHPLSHASSTTSLHPPSPSHMDSNLNNFDRCRSHRGDPDSLSTKILWSETELDTWKSFTDGNITA